MSGISDLRSIHVSILRVNQYALESLIEKYNESSLEGKERLNTMYPNFLEARQNELAEVKKKIYKKETPLFRRMKDYVIGKCPYE